MKAPTQFIKYFPLVGLIILSLAFPIEAFGGPSEFKPGSEPDGFRGIKWGTNISALKDMESIGTDEGRLLKVYIKREDDLNLGGAKLTKILYTFWDGIFYSVVVYTKGDGDYTQIRNDVFEKYGEGDVGSLQWVGQISVMSLKYEEGEGKLYICSREILQKQVIWDKAKQEVKLPSEFKLGSEPDGFRGIKWGADISTSKHLEYFTSMFHGLSKTYIKSGDDLKIGAAQVKKIYYDFWDGKFESVSVRTEGLENYQGLKDAVFEKFGEGARTKEDNYVWEGTISHMELEYKEGDKEGSLWIFSKEIFDKYLLWKKQKGKQGANQGF